MNNPGLTSAVWNDALESLSLNAISVQCDV